jgi:NAD(P)-dependent dehydrogenase (short-subunit alcohol dehydrogenase family)
MEASRAVLLTGSSSGTGLSSGTGKATALRLHRAGWPVYATARSTEALRDLEAEGITTAYLDVTDEQSMAAVVKRIEEEHGSVGVLINNAAFSLNGTVGETPLDEVRRQFEVNVFGLSRLTQLVLPGMRAAGSGRVVMMSSIFGLFATPGRGYYQATKFALEAISDSLRNEVARDGIKVVVVQPSPIRGGFVPTTVDDLDMAGGQEDGPYAEFWKHFVDWHGAYREIENPTGRGRTAVRAEAVAAVIEKAVTADRPKIRYRVGVPVRLLPRQRALFGERAWDRFVRFFFPIP